ncbi:unnamed protein product [Dibothriocephalus latus]|uniref:Uncharacterized protein n=1 Tax=Dibothriocephalus latus TaxID=60516 RepID=A0A3P7P985_DIBLA|nr:unnamed protein product [Dibothriocephalus latus]
MLSYIDFIGSEQAHKLCQSVHISSWCASAADNLPKKCKNTILSLAYADVNAVQTVALVTTKECIASNNQRKLTYELINLIFQLNDQLERQQNRDRQLLEERSSMEKKYIQMLRESKEKMKQTSKKAIRRQAAFEAESNKRLQELQQQRRSLMKRLFDTFLRQLSNIMVGALQLNAAELEAREYKHRTKLLQQRVEHLEEQVNYAVKAIDDFGSSRKSGDEKCDSESQNEP